MRREPTSWRAPLKTPNTPRVGAGEATTASDVVDADPAAPAANALLRLSKTAPIRCSCCPHEHRRSTVGPYTESGASCIDCEEAGQGEWRGVCGDKGSAGEGGGGGGGRDMGYTDARSRGDL